MSSHCNGVTPVLSESDVCVIGAGICGIATVKHCLEYSLSVTCYEQRSALGGLWTGTSPEVSQVGDDGAQQVAVYQSIVMNVSRVLTSFSDFPLPEELLKNVDPEERFLSGAQLLEYLNLFVRHFKIDRHIQLSTRVLDIAKLKAVDENGHRWAVTVRQTVGDKQLIRTTRHRYVVLASGYHSEAFLPKVPGQEQSPVEVIHTGHLRQVDSLRGKRVLVIGGSISAGDIAESAAKAGASKITWAATRQPESRSIWLLRTVPFCKTVTYDECFSLFSYRYYTSNMMRRLWSKMVDTVHQCDKSGVDFNRDRFSVLDAEAIKQAKKSGQLEILPTTIHSLAEGKPQALLSNGMTKDVDVCIMATGYTTTFPYLGTSALDDRKLSDLVLHRSMIPIDPELLGLSFMYTTAVSNGGFCEMEAEARWLVHNIATGKLSSPQEHAKLISDTAWHEPLVSVGRKRSAFNITENLAIDMGCEPRVGLSAFLSPFPWRRRVGLASLFGLWLPHLYRLRGPHARPDAVEDVIVRCAKESRGWWFTATVFSVDVAHALVLGSAACGLFLWSSKRLSA